MKAKTLLRKIREGKKETITSMAEKLNVGISRYYMIESGERPASPEIAEQISNILSVRKEDIFLSQSLIARESSEHTA